MPIIADGFEHDVLESRFEIRCGACGNTERLDVIDILRVAEPSTLYEAEANADFIQSQIARISCSACREDIVVSFGHGEVQPARYRFSLYPNDNSVTHG